MNPTKTLGALLIAVLTLSTAAADPRSKGGLSLAFEEVWEPRSPQTGVFGVVSTHVLQQTPDGSDPQQAWASNDIRGKWGTLRTLDGSVRGLPDVTGLGPNPSWMIREGKLFFHAAPVTAASGESTGGFALISQTSFPRSQRIVLETDLDLTRGSESAFAGVALIAGEGDYRELALYRRGKGNDTIDRVTPLRSSVLAKRKTMLTRVRIDYDPVDGFAYFVNGQLAGREALDHEGASFSADPHIGLYFTGNSAVPAAFAEGFVGPVRVWVGAVGPVASTGAPPP
ncbi:MAG: hypothetical protein NVS3B2_08350 [Ramlibacter sp.]